MSQPRPRTRGAPGTPPPPPPPGGDADPPPVSPRTARRRALEELRETAEAHVTNDPTVDVTFPPDVSNLHTLSDFEVTCVIITFMRYCGHPDRGPLARALSVLEVIRNGNVGGSASPQPIGRDAVELARDRLATVDVYALQDPPGLADRIAPSLIADLGRLGERINYTLQRLQLVSDALGRGGAHGNDGGGGGSNGGSHQRERYAAAALKPGYGDAYHGPTAQPPVDVFEWLCSVDATFEAANASATVPLTDAAKIAHVMSLLRGAVLLDFKQTFEVARQRHHSINTWALYDDTVYDFTAFFVDIHTTLDEREKAFADYVATKSKGYYADPGTIARVLIRKRARVGGGSSTPSHLRIAPGALLNDYLKMLPAEMVNKVFNDVTFSRLNAGDTTAAPPPNLMPGTVQATLAVPLPHDANADRSVFMAINRAVEVSMTAYKAAVSATSATSSSRRPAGLHALIPDAGEPAAPSPPVTLAPTAHVQPWDPRLARIEAAINALTAAAGGGEMEMSTGDATSTAAGTEEAVFASLAQRNYNATKRRETNGNGKPKVPMRCYKCGEIGHGWRDCPKPGNDWVTPFRRFQRRMPPARNNEIAVAKNYVNRNGTLAAIDLFTDDDDDMVDDDEIVYSTTTSGELFYIR